MIVHLPWVPNIAIEFIDKVVMPDIKARCQYHERTPKIFEWGMGGSTLYFNRNYHLRTWAGLIGYIASIEHDPKWFDDVNREILGQRDTRLIPLGPDYPDQILRYPDSIFDLVMVDGRMRVECLKTAKPKITERGWLILDNSDRERYKEGIALYADWDCVTFFGHGRDSDIPWECKIWQKGPYYGPKS